MLRPGHTSQPHRENNHAGQTGRQPMERHAKEDHIRDKIHEWTDRGVQMLPTLALDRPHMRAFAVPISLMPTI